ncbi:MULTISPECIES: CpsD/CapB family tyrosine-protein kinase [unclassified Lysinibacillus]|uniref:CpsD/CapB family tyrosine-protein kinase n=1 Tax=unclassified Lysinibacillus TaxID=2636778 RepID=UPI0035D63BF6
MFFTKKKKKLSTMARKLVTISDSKSIISEQFRTIRTNITFSMSDTDLKTILVTSSIPAEGKSTTVANIGIVFAQEGKKVLIIDADMRKPTLHHTFHAENVTGLSNVLTRQSPIYDVIQETPIDGLNIMTSGPTPPNPSELLASNQLKALILEVSRDFDLIFFDAPPLLPVTDAQILSNKCEGTLLIVNSGVVEKMQLQKAHSILKASQAKLLGAVLNNCEMQSEYYY